MAEFDSTKRRLSWTVYATPLTITPMYLGYPLSVSNTNFILNKLTKPPGEPGELET